MYEGLLFSKTLAYVSRHMHVYVCERTVYKHLLKGKESRLIFIQLKQGLYTLHPTSGRESMQTEEKK